MDLGAPSINISFIEKATDFIERSERGIEALFVEDAAVVSKSNPLTIVSESDIPKELADTTKEQIKLALLGYVTKPKKILVYCIGDLSEAEEDAVSTAYDNAMKAMEIVKFNYAAFPNVETRNLKDKVKDWVKSMREKKKMIHAVLPNTEADSEAVINYATANVTKTDSTTKPDGTVETTDTVYTAEQYCGRIASMICGTPLSMSCTYAELPELTACKIQDDDSEAVNAGKFVLTNDGEKIKTNRAVNSLLTLTSEKRDSFKKIKIVEAMDMITDDISKTIQDSYIGKYPNSYANKQVLVTAILSYFRQLETDGVVSSYDVDLDVEAIKNYLMTVKGKTVEEIAEMSDDDIKKADTGSKVFLKANVTILDAIEDVDMQIYI